MEANEFKDLLPDYVLNRLSDREKKALEQYASENPTAKSQLDQWRELELDLLVETQPSKKMDDTFYATLNDYTVNNKIVKLNPFKNLFASKRFKPVVFVAVAASVLLAGFFLGQYWTQNSTNVTTTIVSTEAVEDAEKETDAVRTQLVISLADQPSAGKRLEALSEVNKLNTATDKVIEALFKMLNSDPNVNVRLAAVTSLSKYVENPIVREGLVMSITQQESPLVQIALADLMVTLKEQKSINSMETLLQKPDINEAVKTKLEESIKQII